MKSFIALIGISVLFVVGSFSYKTHAQQKPEFVPTEFTVVLLSDPGNSVGHNNARIQKEHSAYLEMLASSEKALVVGEIPGKDRLRGILLFEGKSKDKAKVLMDDDPAVKSGNLKTEIFSWYTDKNLFATKRAETPVKLRTYYLAMLSRGPKYSTAATPESQEITMKHLENIKRLAALGKVVLAGPFADAGDLAGFFIFKVDNIDEAKSLAATDPAVVAGRMIFDVHSLTIPKGMLP